MNFQTADEKTSGEISDVHGRGGTVTVHHSRDRTVRKETGDEGTE